MVTLISLTLVLQIETFKCEFARKIKTRDNTNDGDDDARPKKQEYVEHEEL